MVGQLIHAFDDNWMGGCGANCDASWTPSGKVEIHKKNELLIRG